MTASDGYTAEPVAFRERALNLSRSHARWVVLALTIGCIGALAVLKAGGTDSGVGVDAIGGVFAVAFVALALIDFRASVAVTILELVLGGAGGHWVDHGSLSGRIFLISVVTVRAAWLTFADWRRGERPVLGRYGGHALAIAILVPAIWMPLGVLNGNARGDVVADGNGFFFFAFVLVVITLIRSGNGAWLQRVFFSACVLNAAMYFLLIVLTTSGLVDLTSVREWLTGRLAMGGVIGHMPNGQYRLFTAGSLFLVVGLALTAQRLLVRPRSPWLWLVGGMLSVDLVATYTRGLWLAAVVAVVLVLALEVRDVRELGLAVGIPAVAGGLALLLAPLLGFSLYGYVANRAASIAAASHTKYRVHVTDPGFETSSKAWGVNRSRSLHVVRRAVAAHTGSRGLELSNTAAGEDAYVFQNLAVRRKTKYSVSAWLNARAFRSPAASERGLLVWDAQDGLLYTVPLTRKTNGWQRLSFTFATKAHASAVQIRLYAPAGRVLWDGVHLAPRGPARAGSRAAEGSVRVSPVPATSAASTMALDTSAGGGGDVAGEASNSYRIAEAKSLLRYIRKRPIYGYGFGSVAKDFAEGYSYELSYLDLLFKAGALGLLLYLSFPARLVLDALRLHLRRARGLRFDLRGGSPGVVVGVIVGILLAGATNPYLFAAFGLVSFFVLAAWLEEQRPVSGESARSRQP